MTDSRCWIDFKKDRRLKRRSEEGWYGPPSKSYTFGFPFGCPRNAYWANNLLDWCKRRRISYRDDEYGADGAAITRASVKKAQIKNFLAYMYGDDFKHADSGTIAFGKGRSSSVNSLNDLKAFVENELDPDATYELVADLW